MTIRYMEGFELALYQISVGGNILFAQQDTSVRSGGGGSRCLYLHNQNNTTLLYMQTNPISPPVDDEFFIRLSFHSTVLGNTHNHLYLFDQSGNSMGGITFTSTATGTLCGQSVSIAAGFAANTWYSMDIHIKLGITDGVLQIKVNGVTYVDLNNVNTSNSGVITGFTKLQFDKNQGSGETQFRIDDIVVNDALGTVNNGFMNDVRIVGLTPASDETPNDMTPSTGSNHYAVVDEVPPNTGDYLESSSTDTEKFGLTDLTLPSGWGILALQPVSYQAETISTGTSESELGWEIGGTDFWETANPLLFTTSYVDRHGLIYEENPDTGIAWTDSDVDALIIGVRTI